MRTDAGSRGPPWTARCPIASMPATDRTALASLLSSSLPSATSNSRSKRPWSSSSTTLSLRELDPALRTRTRNGLLRPGPIENFRRVLPVVARVLTRVQSLVDHLLANVSRLRAERWDPIDDVHHEVVAIDVVQHRHVEGRGGRALLLVPADVDVRVIRPAIRQAVDQPWVAVVGEDHRLIACEYLVELGLLQSMRMLCCRLQPHQVDDIDHADGEPREVLAAQVSGGERFQRRHVAGARQHRVRLAIPVAARPAPHAKTARAVRDNVLHREIVQRRRLAG